MIPMIYAVLCTFYFILCPSGAVSENVIAPCFRLEATEILREINATSDPIRTILNYEKAKIEVGNSTEKDSLITTKLSRLEEIKKGEGNSTESSNLEKIKKEEGNSTEKELRRANSTDSAQNVKNSSNADNTRSEEENSTGKESPVVKNSSNPENTKKEDNSSDKPLIETKSSNIDKTKKEEGNLTGKESTKQNLTDSAQKSPLERHQSKTIVRVARYLETELSDTEPFKSEYQKEKFVTGKAFISTFRKCKLIKDKILLHDDATNVDEINKCITEELRNLETYPGQFLKYLNNPGVIRKA